MDHQTGALDDAGAPAGQYNRIPPAGQIRHDYTVIGTVRRMLCSLTMTDNVRPISPILFDGLTADEEHCRRRLRDRHGHGTVRQRRCKR